MHSECLAFIILFPFVRCAMEGFIVGGKYTFIKQHPHSVFLKTSCMTKYKMKRYWVCGASIVNQEVLLTAAHCLDSCTTSSNIAIKVGHAYKNRGINYTANDFVIHEDYDPRANNYDIGLVRVNKPIQLTARVARVALMRNPPYTEKAFVTGWGLTNEIMQNKTERLKVLAQKVWKRSKCINLFKMMPEGTICASAKNKMEFAAQGDSGSALVVRGYIQIGIVSYKVPATANNVVVYTDVGYYYKWIKNNAKQLHCLKPKL